MTEAIIQDLLARHCIYNLQHIAACPNINIFTTGECDLVSINKNQYAVEYEVKISKSDFFADFKKRKHEMFNDPFVYDYRMPAYFYYATPKDLVQVDDVPKHAGLVYVYETVRTYDSRPVRHYEIKKRAPRIHKERITPDQMGSIARGCMYRYWNLRLKIEGGDG